MDFKLTVPDQLFALFMLTMLNLIAWTGNGLELFN